MQMRFVGNTVPIVRFKEISMVASHMAAALRRRTVWSPAMLAVLAMLAAIKGAEADPLQHFPLVISCEHKGSYNVFYLVRVIADGTATYIASGKIAGTITLKGNAKAVGGSSGGSCVGKTLDELRSSGQAYDAKR